MGQLVAHNGSKDIQGLDQSIIGNLISYGGTLARSKNQTPITQDFEMS